MEARRGTTACAICAAGLGGWPGARIDRRHDGRTCSEPPALAGGASERGRAHSGSRRIGMTQAAARLLRYYEAGNPYRERPESSALLERASPCGIVVGVARTFVTDRRDAF